MLTSVATGRKPTPGLELFRDTTALVAPSLLQQRETHAGIGKSADAIPNPEAFINHTVFERHMQWKYTGLFVPSGFTPSNKDTVRDFTVTASSQLDRDEIHAKLYRQASAEIDGYALRNHWEMYGGIAELVDLPSGSRTQFQARLANEYDITDSSTSDIVEGTVLTLRCHSPDDAKRIESNLHAQYSQDTLLTQQTLEKIHITLDFVWAKEADMAKCVSLAFDRC